MKLENKNVVVTGGAMGIGLATTKRLLEEGCKVNVWDINEGAIENARRELLKYSDRLFFHKCDVTNKNEVYSMAVAAKSEMGKVDIVINNAGFVKGGYLNEVSDDAWEQTIDVNLTSLIYTTKAFIDDMYERNEGFFVNISSASSMLGVSEMAVYTATKWAVWGFTESMRFEALTKNKKGVKFSSIHPSYLAEGMFEGAKLNFLGNLIVPLVKSHDVIANAIVNDALKIEKLCIKRPRTVRLAVLFRGILPDKLFQKVIVMLGIHKSMSGWKGRG
ncbi:MAG: SDR family NAD(P)-dependent oxidoreductase [Melioribacteraceae bacterium]|nr:SDR family NAD(P)-dependent oxidoreductase [Melioribacteraceae bacterium]WKZ68026.1 MAG: SDR family NAD(P)-dependent oxidoreductase [Melioribacteraceae bacterium]